MIILNVQQGTPEWHAARATHDCASEAAAALGLSKTCTRSELMKIKHTGITPDVSEWTQKFLFDKGHEVEALARPIVAKILGEALHPVTGESDDGKLLASLDGFTMFGDTVWENKLLNPALRDFIIENNDLPDTHWPQCEHQLLVTDADRVYFTVSDGTEEGTTGIFYQSKPERTQRLIAGWSQFNKDLVSYEPPENNPAAVAEAIEELPALRVQLVGQVTSSNLATFKDTVMERIKAINTTLVTDADFVNADKMVKFLDDGEKRLELVKSQALSQTATIDELFRTIDGLKAEMRSKRLTLDKLVKSEKESRKAEIVDAASKELAAYISDLNERIGLLVIKASSHITVSIQGAIYGLKSLDSMRDKVSVALANAKIEADAIADRIEANRKTVEDMSLFPDFSQVCTKAPDDFAALLAMRSNARKDAEEKRLNAERERIRAEEQAKAQREASQKAAAEIAAAQATARREAQEAAAKAEIERIALTTSAICTPAGTPIEAKTLISVMEQKQEVADVSLVYEANNQPDSYTLTSFLLNNKIYPRKGESPLFFSNEHGCVQARLNGYVVIPSEQFDESKHPIEHASATPARDTDRSGPRVTSLRIQIAGELEKMNVFELANVLAYCQVLPIKTKLAA